MGRRLMHPRACGVAFNRSVSSFQPAIRRFQLDARRLSNGRIPTFDWSKKMDLSQNRRRHVRHPCRPHLRTSANPKDDFGDRDCSRQDTIFLRWMMRPSCGLPLTIRSSSSAGWTAQFLRSSCSANFARSHPGAINGVHSCIFATRIETRSIS